MATGGGSHRSNRVVHGLVQITIPRSSLVQMYRVVIIVMIYYGMPCDRAQWKRMGAVLPCGVDEGGWIQQPGFNKDRSRRVLSWELCYEASVSGCWWPWFLRS